MMRANLRAARRESSSLLAPMHTILPEQNMIAVVRGERMRMMTAQKRFGLYSELGEFIAIFFTLSKQPRFTMLTMFLLIVQICNIHVCERVGIPICEETLKCQICTYCRMGWRCELLVDGILPNGMDGPCKENEARLGIELALPNDSDECGLRAS